MNRGPRERLITDPSAENGLCVCVLASGSTGNSVYIADGQTHILLDAGLSGRELERRMKSRRIDPQKLDAIVVSHEHGDHLRGVGVLSRRYRLPVYINEKTFQAGQARMGRLWERRAFECGTGFRIEKLTIHPFSLSHDAADTAGFTIARNGSKIGIATDLGVVPALVRQHLQGADLLIVEANHDPDMLMAGPYPWHLKQRIQSRNGHLSNGDACQLLRELAHDRLRHVVLAHLSEKNNRPEKARSEAGAGLCHCRAELSVALPDRCGELLWL